MIDAVCKTAWLVHRNEIEKVIREAVGNFSCKDKDVEHFLKNKSFDFEKRDKSRTYLVFDDEKYAMGDASIVGYFTK